MFLRSLEDHAGCRLATTGLLTGNVRAKIGRIDQIITQLLQHFCFNGTVLLNCKRTATDAALVRNDNELKAIGLQPPQCFRDARENLHIFRVGTIISILHNGAVTIDKDGWSSCFG